MNIQQKLFFSILVVLTVLACNFAQEFLATPKGPTESLVVTPTEVSHVVIQPPTPTPIARATPTPSVPDVIRIAYTDNGNVWIIEGENPPRQLTSSENTFQVIISSDGMKVAFTRWLPDFSGTELRSVNSAGGSETILLDSDEINGLYPSGVETAGFEINQIAFLPGTHDLYFNTMELFQEIGVQQHDDLLRINADAGELTRILPPQQGGHFVIAPDGSKIAIIRPDSIDLIHPNGDPLLKNAIIYSPVITYSEFRYYAQPVWFRDSSLLGVVIPSEDPLAEYTTGTIWILPTDGSSAASLGTIPGDFYFPQVFSSSILSPQLNRVILIRDNETEEVSELYIANITTMEEEIYISGEIHWGSWSPNGQHFVFGYTDPMSIYLGSEGREPLSLSNGTNFRWINGEEYLYLSGSRGDWTLMKGALGEAPIALAHPAGDYISFDFDQ